MKFQERLRSGRRPDMKLFRDGPVVRRTRLREGTTACVVDVTAYFKIVTTNGLLAVCPIEHGAVARKFIHVVRVSIREAVRADVRPEVVDNYM